MQRVLSKPFNMNPVRPSISLAAPTLKISDHRTLLLSSLGGALEFYDFIIFVFFAPVIGQLFFPQSIPEWLRQAQTFGIFAAGYLARPLGGVIMAHFGDLSGRKKMFTLSVILMSLPTFAIAIIPTYVDIGIFAPILLLVCRICQGAAVGGEVPGAWVFVSEHMPTRYVGYACGLLTGGLTFGIFIGSVVASSIHSTLSTQAINEYGWRVPFVIGGFFGLLAAFLRRWLKETPVFMEMKDSQSLAKEAPLKAVLRNHKKSVFTSMMLTWTLTAGIVVVILMTPALIEKRFQISPAISLKANAYATACLTAGCILAGIIAGKIGASKTIFFGCLLQGASYLLMLHLLTDFPVALIPLYAISGFFVGTIAAIPVAMVNAFPSSVRFSGISFSYNVAYALFGGITPVLISLLSSTIRQAPEAYVGVLCVAGAIAGLATPCLVAKK